MPLPGHLSSLYPDVTTVLIFFTVDQFCPLEQSHRMCSLALFLFDKMIFRFISVIVCISNLFLFISEQYFFWGVVGVFVAAHGLQGSGGCDSLQSTGSEHMGFGSSSTQAQQLCFMDLVALQHVGSSQTRDQTHVPCINRQIFILCATREVPEQCSIV